MTVVPLRQKKPKSPFANATSFKKGHAKLAKAGRAKGTPNRTTVLLKQAIIDAAEQVGRDGRGKEGLVGYLKMLAVKEKAVYARLLEKVLPLQLRVEDKTTPTLTAAEAVQRLEQRGLPVPIALRTLADGVARPTVPSEYEAELRGEGFEGAGVDVDSNE
jgi:hypothetical protein